MFFKRILLTLSCIIFLLVLPLTILFEQQQQQTQQHAAASITEVTVNPANGGKAIPANFAGFSWESPNLCDQLHADSSGPTIANLMKNLGTGVFVYHGSGVESTSWNPTGPGSCSYGGSVFTPVLIDKLAALLKKTNWQLIWGVNFKNGTPSNDADNIAYVSSALGASLLAVELGDEPDGYYPYPTFKTNWETFYTAITAKTPHVPFVGPETGSGNHTFTDNFITDEHTKVTQITWHLYPTSHYAGGIYAPTLTNLLSPNVMNNIMVPEMTAAIPNATAVGLPTRIDGNNSVAVGGVVGVSDVFGAALWAADSLFTTAENGGAGFDFHGGDGDPYSAIHPDGSPAPLYYGVLFFHQAAQNGKIIPNQINTSMNVVAHSVLGNDGSLRVVMINKDQTNPATVQINTTQTYAHASVLRLTAPSVTATTGITLGGSSIAADGTWHPAVSETLATTGPLSTITVAPTSAVMITYQNSTILSSSPAPSGNPTALPTTVQRSTTFSITLCPHGLGNCGDNANSNGGGNTTPQHTTRNAKLTALDQNNQPAATAQGTVQYDTTKQQFTGTIPITTLTSGQYLVSLKMDGYLSKQIPGIVTVTQGQTDTLPAVSLVTGDINNDNQLDILDYNLLIGCFGSKATTASCQNKTASDITDNGIVDGADFNLFLRELSVQKGG